MKEIWIGGACCMHGRGDRSIQNCSWKVWMEATIKCAWLIFCCIFHSSSCNSETIGGDIVQIVQVKKRRIYLMDGYW